MAKFGGSLTYREDANGDGMGSVALTYEFEDFERGGLLLSRSASKASTSKGLWIMGQKQRERAAKNRGLAVFGYP